MEVGHTPTFVVLMTDVPNYPRKKLIWKTAMVNVNHRVLYLVANDEGYLRNLSFEFPRSKIQFNILRGQKIFSFLSLRLRQWPPPWGAIAAFYLNVRSAIYLPALPNVIIGLDGNSNLVNLTVALYMFALGLFPLWWSAASERVGRRSVYVISFALWIVFNALCATSQHIIELIIMRIMAAGAGASVLAVGAGTVADIYIPQQRGRAMGWFSIGPLTAPLIVSSSKV